jgi:hypothetical protein
MSNPGELPGDAAGKLAYLERAASHGVRLRPLFSVGAPLEPVQAYVAANPDLTAERGSRSFDIRYGELVRWDVLLDEGDRIVGHNASGYAPLMTALGIDFRGSPYVDDNG